MGITKEEFRGWKYVFALKTHAEVAMAYRATAVVHNMRASWNKENKRFKPKFHDRFPRTAPLEKEVPEGFFDTRVLTPNLDRLTYLHSQCSASMPAALATSSHKWSATHLVQHHLHRVPPLKTTTNSSLDARQQTIELSPGGLQAALDIEASFLGCAATKPVGPLQFQTQGRSR